MDDGSGVSVKVVVPSGVALPTKSYAVVTGISSCYKEGGVLKRLVRVRGPGEIKEF